MQSWPGEGQMIIRLYTGGDAEAHFEDLNIPAGEADTVALKSGNTSHGAGNMLEEF